MNRHTLMLATAIIGVTAVEASVRVPYSDKRPARRSIQRSTRVVRRVRAVPRREDLKATRKAIVSQWAGVQRYITPLDAKFVVKSNMLGRSSAGYWKKWFDAYAATGTVERVVWNVPELRVIAELRVPFGRERKQRQRVALKRRAKAGYNAVLVVYEGGKPESLLPAIARARQEGMLVIFAYGPGESADNPTPYIDLDTLRRAYEIVLPHCDACLLTWRVSSPHFWSGMDPGKYPAVMARLARAARPGIPLIGEIYLNHMREFKSAVTPGCSAALVNSGIVNVVPEGPAGLFAKCQELTDVPLLAVCLRYQYWQTRDRKFWQERLGRKLTREEVQKATERKNRRFLDAGFVGVLNYAGDASGGRYDYRIDDSIESGLTETETETEKEKDK